MAAPAPIGVVTGLASEARVAEALAADLDMQTPRPLVRCAGASPRRAGRAALALLDKGAAGLISFGIAGALDPALRAGQVVLGCEVFTPLHHLLPSDAAWCAAIEEAAARSGLGLHAGRIAGSDRLVASVSMKQRLAALSEARATDMESHAVASVAWEARVPFVALRSILDEAASGLPSIVRGSVDRHGRPRKLLVAARLVLAPWNYKTLKSLEKESREAHRALVALAPLAPVLFGGAP
jgi:hypothetical protein